MNNTNKSLMYGVLAAIVVLIIVVIAMQISSPQNNNLSDNVNSIVNMNVNADLNTNGVSNLNLNNTDQVSGQNTNMNRVVNQNENTLPVTDTFNTYENAGTKISLQYPATIVPQASFANTYLIPDTWSALSASSTTGNKLVALTLPGSNEITSGGIRISTSKDAADVINCSTAPTYATFEKTIKTINGNTFTVLSLSDAAMNHYSTINSYRLVKNNLCYVIDAYVTGTNPEVYDPKPIPPFTKDAAFASIDALLGTLKIN